MLSLREVKTRIYQTSCKEHLKEGLCLSEPIITIGGKGLIDNFFQYPCDETGTVFGKPDMVFGIYSDSGTIAYLNKNVVLEDKEYFAKRIETPEQIAEIYRRYEEEFPVVREHIYRSDYGEYEDILKQYFKDLKVLSGEIVWGFYQKLIPAFFEWYERNIGNL